MRQGFSLIELMVVLTISSGIALMLFQVYNQSMRILGRVDGIVSTDIRVFTFYDRFEKDVTGAFIPLIGDLELAKKMLEKHEGDVRTQQLKQQEKSAEGSDKEKKSEKPQKVKPVTLADIQVKRSFVCSQKDGKLSQLSFITNNPMEVYSEGSSVVKPRIARVSYSVEPEKDKKGFFKLVRRESQKFKLDAIKKERPYTLLNNIKSLKLELLATESEKEPEKKDAEKGDKVLKDTKKEGSSDKKEKTPGKEEKQEEEKIKPLKTYTEWPAPDEKEDVKSKDDKKKSPPRDLPQFIKVYLTYEDQIEGREKSYEFMIPIFSFSAPSKELLSFPLLVQERLQKEEEEGGPAKAKSLGKTESNGKQPKGAQK